MSTLRFFHPHDFTPYTRGDHYYAYYWEEGKRVFRSLKTKSSRLVKQKIQELCDELNSQVAKKAQDTDQRSKLTVGGFCDEIGFLQPGTCPYLQRMSAHGRYLKPQTICNYSQMLKHYILPTWGSKFVADPSLEELEDWALNIRRRQPEGEGELLALSYRSRILLLFHILLNEAARKKLRDYLPEAKGFIPDPKEKGTLSDAELLQLFPNDETQARKLWASKADNEKETLLFFVFFATMVSAGLRSGEARALKPEDLHLDLGLLAITHALDAQDVDSFLKKGNKKDPHHRVVAIPDRTVALLSRWIVNSGEYVFEYRGKTLPRTLLDDRLQRALNNIGIDWKARNLSPHSLRYTYRTRMEQFEQEKNLLDSMGHKSAQMGRHYSRPHLIDRINQVAQNREGINQFWGKE